MHVEIFFDPQGHTDRGVSFGTVINGITSALEAGRKKFDISSRLIMCFLRHLDELSAEKTLDSALFHKTKIHGVGLDSSELGHPPSKFRNVFNRARTEGFKLVAHAGEEGPPEYVTEALDILRIDRLDHGNRSLEDAALTERLVQSQIALTVCPLSNYKLAGVTDMRKHPLREMLDKGLNATINSDDPAYFGGYMTENYTAVADALDLGVEEIITLARNGISATFCTTEEKTVMQGKLDAYLTAQGVL
jgi:adenosine deaminase